MENNKAHSDLSASKSGQWINCPGSIKVCAKIPEEQSSEYAAEGTAAHKLIDLCFKHSMPDIDMLDYKEFVQKDLFPAEYRKYVTADMLEHINFYLDFVWGKFNESGAGKKLLSEQKFSLEFLHPGMFGTADNCIVETLGALRVIDFKYGQGVQVHAERNTQGLYYALGALNLFKGKCFEEIIINIIQPRGYGNKIQEFSISPEELRVWGQEVLLPAALATEQADAPLVIGDHCKEYFCKALKTGKCPAINSAVKGITKRKDSVTGELPAPTDLTPQEIARILDLKDIFIAWLGGVEKTAMNLLENGEEVEGYKLVETEKRRKWIDEANAIKELSSRYPNIPLYAPAELKSPAQIEKIKGITGIKEEVAKLTFKPEGGVGIARVGSSKKEISNSAERDFGDVKI